VNDEKNVQRVVDERDLSKKGKRDADDLFSEDSAENGDKTEEPFSDEEAAQQANPIGAQPGRVLDESDGNRAEGPHNNHSFLETKTTLKSDDRFKIKRKHNDAVQLGDKEMKRNGNFVEFSGGP
jgi:hypothetical protein